MSDSLSPPPFRPSGTTTPPPPPFGSDGPGSAYPAGGRGPRGLAPGSTARVLAAWVMLAMVVAGWVGLQQHKSKLANEGAAAEAEAANVSGLVEMQGRLLVALARFGGGSPMFATALKDAEPPADAPWIEHLAFVVLSAEIEGPKRGIEILDTLVLPESASTDDRALVESVRERLRAWSEGSERIALPAAEAERLGWYAKLLDGTVEVSSGIVIGLVVFLGWYLVFGAVGLVALVTLAVLAALGRVRSSFSPSARGGIYAEAFAIWFLLFLGGQVIGFSVLEAIGRTDLALGVGIGAMAASLLALAWPVLCGVAWADVRRDVGLVPGRGYLTEVGSGILCYAMALPMLGLGVVIYAVLKSLFAEKGQPSHPVVEELGQGGFGGIALIFALACIAAPIVEEIAFRGMLYRHLRDASVRFGVLASALIATLVSSFLFAAIHPQGLLFAPALMGLAFSFCLMREWRGSLVAPMVAHGINNAVTLSLGLMLTGS